VLPRPPFVPAWIPDWALLANSLAVEVALLAAAYFLVVRRAERKRRAVALFSLIVLALGTAQVLAYMELVLEPRLRYVLFVHDRFPDAKEHPSKFARFYFAWLETRVLRRASARYLMIDEQPIPSEIVIDVPRDDGFEIRFRGGRVYDGKLPEELWALHDGPPDEATGDALWERFSRGALASQVDEIADFVGKPRR
jgi:hypothetical protein